MIKKGNLSASLLNWLMSTLQLGPGIGDVFYLVVSGSAYHVWLLNQKVSGDHIFTTLAAAYAATTASRNDVILAFPGAYVQTAELAWTNAHTHLIGLGGPNIGGDYSEPNVVFYTTTANVASVLTVTGAYSQFHNFVVENNKDDADNLTAATINIYGTRWKSVAFHGNMQSTQNATAVCASLYIGAAGMYPLIEDCIIGQDVWGERAAANSGVLRFSSTGGRPNGGIFRRCQLLSTGSTVTCAMVAIPAATSTGRGWLFDQCTFQHFNDAGVSLNQAFYSVGAGVEKHTMLLHQCSAFGIDEWQDANDDVVISTMGVATVGGGLHIQPTATVS